MTALFLFIVVWAAGSLAQSAFRKVQKPRKRKTAATVKPPAAMVEYKPAAIQQSKPAKPPIDNGATIAALQMQRETILNEINRLKNISSATATPKNPAITNRLEVIEKLLRGNIPAAARRAYESEKAQLEVLLFENGGIKTKELTAASAENVLKDLKTGKRKAATDPGKTAARLASLYGKLATVENKLAKLQY